MVKKPGKHPRSKKWRLLDSRGGEGGGCLTPVWIQGFCRGFEILTLFGTKILDQPYPV